MSAQIIKKDGRPEYAVLPYEEYQALLEKAEDLEDIAAFDQAVLELEEDRDEVIPHEIVKQLVEGENPVRVWRAYRNLTQTALAQSANVSQSYVAMLERGERVGSVSALNRIARALQVDLDDLIDEPADR